MAHSSFRLHYPSESLSVQWVVFITRSSFLSSDWTPLTLLQRWLSTLIWLLVVCLWRSPLSICYSALFGHHFSIWHFSLDWNFLHWPSLSMVIASKCMLVCLMWIKFIYELYRNIRGNSFVLDVRIQRAVFPFIEVAHGAMCDLPESEFLTSRFSQSFASGSFFSQLLMV